MRVPVVDLPVPVEWRVADVRRVVDAIAAASWCCDCLGRETGLSPAAVRRAVIAVSRAVRLGTWTPCRACGAVDETYGPVRP